MRVFISAGEASADALGAALIHALRAREPKLEVYGMGGSAMQAAGFEARFSADLLNVAGFVEVAPKIPRLMGLLVALFALAVRRRPDVAVLIDAPDFHLRLARLLTALGVPVVQYVAPTVWAWRPWRVRAYRKSVASVLLLFPFEQHIWARAGISACFVGHALLEAIREPAQAGRPLVGSTPRPKSVALLPGSRPAEIRQHLLPLLETGRQLVRRQGVRRLPLLVAPTVKEDVLRTLECSVARSLVEPVFGDARREALADADLALLSSGTATVEAGLLGVPQVIIYRLHKLSFAIGRRLARVEHLGLFNLLLGRREAPELLQDELTPDRLVAESERLLTDPESRARAVRAAGQLRELLGPLGASDRAAEEILRVARRR